MKSTYESLSLWKYNYLKWALLKINKYIWAGEPGLRECEAFKLLQRDRCRFPFPKARFPVIQSWAQLPWPGSVVLPPPHPSPCFPFPACFSLCQTSPLGLALAYCGPEEKWRSPSACHIPCPHHPTWRGPNIQKGVGLFFCISLPLNRSFLQGAVAGGEYLDGTDRGDTCTLISKLSKLYTLNTYI